MGRHTELSADGVFGKSDFLKTHVLLSTTLNHFGFFIAQPHYHRLVPVKVLRQLIETGTAPTFEGTSWKVFEVSSGHSLCTTGHIPTAQYMHTENLEEPPMWNRKEDHVLERELLALGITSETTVILYDRQNLSAARVALIMAYAGRESLDIHSIHLLNLICFRVLQVSKM